MRRCNLVLNDRDWEHMELICEAANCTKPQAFRLALRLMAKIARETTQVTIGGREIWILDLE
jgi:hypothetical protein